jgi:hypothetical protein
MSLREFNSWVQFYRLFPFDDAHRYFRPAALLAKANGSKASIKELMEFLQPDPVDIGDLKPDQQAMAKSLMAAGFRMARKAKV